MFGGLLKRIRKGDGVIANFTSRELDDKRRVSRGQKQSLGELRQIAN